MTNDEMERDVRKDFARAAWWERAHATFIAVSVVVGAALYWGFMTYREWWIWNR